MENKYSDKEIIAGINIVNSILDLEDFKLDVNEYDVGGDNWTQELKFNLIDKQGGNLNGIEQETFDTLASVLDRLDIYHEDHLYNPYEQRIEANEKIERDDWDRKILIFLSSDYCTSLLQNISAATYSDYVKTGFGKNQDRLKENEGIDELSLLIDKDIAQKIIETQSAYTMVEYENKVYLSYYGFGDNTYEEYDETGEYPIRKVSNEEALLDDIKSPIQSYDEYGNNTLFTKYDNYKELINSQISQIYSDINDLGLDGFYLSINELEYIGISEKYITMFREDLTMNIPATKLPEEQTINDIDEEIEK